MTNKQPIIDFEGSAIRALIFLADILDGKGTRKNIASVKQLIIEQAKELDRLRNENKSMMNSRGTQEGDR